MATEKTSESSEKLPNWRRFGLRAETLQRRKARFERRDARSEVHRAPPVTWWNMAVPHVDRDTLQMCDDEGVCDADAMWELRLSLIAWDEQQDLFRGLARDGQAPESRVMRQCAECGLPHDLSIQDWSDIRSAYHNRCAYCGNYERLVIEHMVPVTRGGGTTPANIVPSCDRCNKLKLVSTAEEFCARYPRLTAGFAKRREMAAADIGKRVAHNV